jgi:hypothetical protein
MKSEFLKIAGVKSDKAFYKKYPTEAAFFKAHPEAKKMVKKAQAGTIMSGMSSYLQGMQGAQNIPNMQNVIQGQMQSPGVNAGMFSDVSTINASQLADNKSGYVSPGGPNTNVEKMNNIGNEVSKLVPVIGQIASGYQNLRAGRRAKKEAQKWAGVTGVLAGAAEYTDVDDFRQYAENARKRRDAFMPEMTGEEFFPVYGVGTNVLARNGARLQEGGMVGGNPTEIQNTYTPGTLYDDLGYEPLNDSNQVKSYKMGGHLPKAAGGAELFDPSSMMSSMGGGATPWGAIGGMGSSLAGNMTGNDGGGQIGGAIGGAAGMAIGGPAGQAIGQTLGTLAGGLLDTNDRDQRKAEARTKNNINRMMSAQFANDIHQQYGAYAKDGGWVSHDWQPQVIAKFGDLDAQDYAEFAKKDQFRAGGHLKAYREPSERAMQTYDMGGELQTHWGGYAEPMSENPYLPGGGETVMFRGKSHEESDGKGNTGIGITFGDSPVEVERGEPAVKLKDGSSGEESLVVYGNLKISKDAAKFIGDEKAEGMKYKNYIADKSKFETKQNKLIQKSTEELGNFDPKDAYDKLKVAGLEAKILGGKMNLKEVAKIKEKSAFSQNTINETAEEYGLVADDLARGKVKFDKEAMKAQAKYGAAIEKADKGKKLKSVSAIENVPKGQKRNEQTGFFGKVTPEMFEKMKERNAWYDWENFDPKDENDVYDFQGKFNALAKSFGQKGIQYDGDFGEQTASADSSWFKSRERGKDLETPEVKDDKKETPAKEDDKFEIIKHKKNPWITAFNELLPYIRPTDQEALDPRQLMGELYALSTNKLEPVQATPYTPQLRVPYDISLQDQLNEITADQRSAQRMMGYNPAAQSNLAAQTYGAKSKVLADQFRMNQAMKDQIYSGNIATLNDAELKNLDIYDRQYGRQEQAKSNTKATAQAALNSIADKYAKNALENRTLGTYENLYNYRYDASGRAVNMNPLAQYNIPQKYPQYNDPNYRLVQNADGTYSYKKVSGEEETTTKAPSRSTPGINPNSNVAYEDDEYEYELVPMNQTEAMNEVAPKKYGGKVKKNYSQSSIVKAFK